jgi:uncharacterized membrane protein YfcA
MHIINVMTTDWFPLTLAFLTSIAAAAMNSIAGGGTLLTFPLLMALGLDGKTANATSTIGLWAGSLGGAWGYRKEVMHNSALFWPFFLSSLLGGIVGSFIFLYTEKGIFNGIVPWLILIATLLFACQSLVKKMMGHKGETHFHPDRWPLVALIQFVVGIYGGYFGAGMGILMLAILAFLGLHNIHRMNGIKNIAATIINGVTIIIFVAYSFIDPQKIHIDWPIAGVMVAGAIIGGYGCTGIAKKLPIRVVRVIVILIGLVGAIVTAYKTWFVQ